MLGHVFNEGHSSRCLGTEQIDPLVYAGNTVMIGDGHPDVLAARAAGAQVIGCDFGFSRTDLASACPDALVTSPLDWVDLICGT